MLFALALPLVVGGAGMGVETAYWYARRTQLQEAADVAAHAAAIEKRAGGDEAAMLSIATSTAIDSGYAPSEGTITVNSPPASGPSAGSSAVEVLLTGRAKRMFTALFDDGDLVLNARAVASFNTAATACILALDKAASDAATFQGNTHVTLQHCSVMSNSVSNSALSVQGSATLSTDCVISAGGVSVTSGLTMTQCPEAVINAPQVADPFKDVPVPTFSGCSNPPGNPSSLSPGCYNKLDLKNNVSLAPGVYVINGGDFKINANANIVGSGVTFYLTGGARVDFNGTATMNLSAPTSGPYSGILMFGDRAVSGLTNSFNGTAASSLTGALYFANQAVDYSGNFSGTNGCTQVVAKTIKWTGSTTIAANCSSLGMRTLPALTTVRLTE